MTDLVVMALFFRLDKKYTIICRFSLFFQHSTHHTPQKPQLQQSEQGNNILASGTIQREASAILKAISRKLK
jgi:hypothetical protein